MPQERYDEGSDWTPYPHEPLRVRLVWRRRFILLALLVAAFILWLTLFKGPATELTETISTVDQEGNVVSVTRDLRPQKSFEAPDARVTVRPGQTARTTPIEQTETGDQPTPTTAPPVRPPSDIPFFGLLILFAPMLLALWLFRRFAPPAPEVNYGIYKGALPFEIITASHRHLVLTSRRVDENPFGRERADYLADAGCDEHGLALWWMQGMPGPS
ncbi:MAG: hypothetical protein ACRELA_11205 [Candidatus Rokuibacteriota bacterium]